jgi:hypothetical protein
MPPFERKKTKPRSWRDVLDTTLCDMVFQWLATGQLFLSGYSGFLHQLNWPPRYSWNIAESDIKHHYPNNNPQTLASFKKYMPPPLPYFKVNICPFPLPYFASIFFAYLWSFRWPNYIVTLPRYFSLRLPHLNIRIQPLPVCAGFFICIRNSLYRPCVTMPSWSFPLKCKVSL